MEIDRNVRCQYVHGRTVLAKTSVAKTSRAKTSVAEMSEHLGGVGASSRRDFSLFSHEVFGSVVVDSLLIVTPIVRFCNCSMFCCALLYVHSSFAIILMGKRELVALLCLSSLCLVIVVWLFLAVLWVCVQFVIVVFSDHTRLLFLLKRYPFECWIKSFSNM